MRWNVSALASFEFHTDKRETIEHVGNILTPEGGIGSSFLKGTAKAGLVYYAVETHRRHADWVCHRCWSRERIVPRVSGLN
jgi:hypothetical protein